MLVVLNNEKIGKYTIWKYFFFNHFSALNRKYLLDEIREHFKILVTEKKNYQNIEGVTSFISYK